MTGRLVIEDVRPRTPNRGHYAKAVLGEAVRVNAVIFKEGHDQLAGRVLLLVGKRRAPDSVAALESLGNDEWAGVVVPQRMGAHRIVVEAWTDRLATWAHKVRAKLGADQEIAVEIAEGVTLLEPYAGDPLIDKALVGLLDDDLDASGRVAAALRRGGSSRLGPASSR